MYILQVGRSGVPSSVLASPFRPTGQERSPKSAPQHVPTVTCKAKRAKTKLELKVITRNIEKKLSAWKDFVFPHPLLPFGTIWESLAHCTHLQIAHAVPQTKICKRVQFLPSQNKSFKKLILLKDLLLSFKFMPDTLRILFSFFKKQ